MDIYQIINSDSYLNNTVSRTNSNRNRIFNNSRLNRFTDSLNSEYINNEESNEENTVENTIQNTMDNSVENSELIALQEQIENMYQYINDTIMNDNTEDTISNNDNISNNVNNYQIYNPSDTPSDTPADTPSDIQTDNYTHIELNEHNSNIQPPNYLNNIEQNNVEQNNVEQNNVEQNNVEQNSIIGDKYSDMIVEEFNNMLIKNNEDNEIDETNIMINIFDSNIANKIYLFIAQGWYMKDEKLKKNMYKHDLLGTCVYCIKNFKYEDIRLFKNLPYKKCKINNIQTNNLFCVCQKCYSTVATNNIVVPPNNIDDIKKIIFSKFNDIVEYNHCLLYHKEIKSGKTKLDDLKQEYNKLIKAKNYFQNTNKLLKNSIDFEKTKHKYLSKIKKNNIAMLNKLTTQSITNFQKMYTSQIKNVEKLCGHMESICDIDKDKKVECKICMTNNIEMALPCGHTCCLSCIEQIRNTNYDIDFDIWTNEDANMKKCPICRTTVDLNNVLPIYL
jgi:hypothetical protein